MKTKENQFVDDSDLTHLALAGESCAGCGGSVRARRRSQDHRVVMVCAGNPECNVQEIMTSREQRILARIALATPRGPTADNRDYKQLFDSERRAINLVRARDRALSILASLPVENDPFAEFCDVDAALFGQEAPHSPEEERLAFVDCVTGAFLIVEEQAEVYADEWKKAGELPSTDEVRRLCGHVCSAIVHLLIGFRRDFDRPLDAILMVELALIYAHGVLAPWGTEIPKEYRDLWLCPDGEASRSAR